MGGPDDEDYVIMLLADGAVFCNICVDSSDIEAFETQAPKRWRTSTHEKYCETPVDLSIHEDSIEKTFKETFVKSSIMHIAHCKLEPFCCVCKFVATTECQLSVHMKTSHPHVHPYCCTHCDRVYNTHNDWDTHVRAVHWEKALKCKLCPYTAEKEYKMVKHATVH